MNRFCMCLMLLFSSLYAEDEKKNENIALMLSRTNNIPSESVEDKQDSYFEGYLQALIDMHYYEYRVIVVVHDETVWLFNLPRNKLLSDSITSFVRDVPGVKCVEVVTGCPPKEVQCRAEAKDRPRIRGIWFPQTTELYLPMIANPRQVYYSLGYRGNDPVTGKCNAVFSLGDNFPIFRWLGVLPWCGDLQIGIETGMWSVFNLKPKYNPCGGTEMVNADFFVGIPLAYAVNEWAFRLRIWHESSHLGDEFIVNHPTFVDCENNTNPKEVRVNPSMEAVDFYVSYQANRDLRVYGGMGVVYHSDRTFKIKPLFFEYGGEYDFWGCKYPFHKLYGNFFVAVYFRNWQYFDFEFDQTYMFGYEFSKIHGVGRKIRFVVDYHNGYSVEGQFMKCRTSYWEVKMIWGY